MISSRGKADEFKARDLGRFCDGPLSKRTEDEEKG